MTMPAALEPIPQPPGHLIVGNLLDIDRHQPMDSLMGLAREYGPLYQLALPGGQKRLIASGFTLVDQLCDDAHFDKALGAGLRTVNQSIQGGLFTSETTDPNWRKAHNILLPSFSLQAMRNYLPMMLDLAVQLVQKWERLNDDDTVDVPADMTRLTLDTIGLCGFGYRFNSFYREEPHPFVASMVYALSENTAALSRLPIQNKLMRRMNRQLQESITLMNSTVDRIIAERKASEDQPEKKDLLSYMLTGADKETGEGLDDVNIRYQIITFLIAGHETTSGLLSFTLYYLLNKPEVLAKAYDEVDSVLGGDLSRAPTYEQVKQLRYVSQVLK